MVIFKTRYRANKEKKNSQWYSTSNVTVKVDGGYTIMTPSQYEIWRKQKWELKLELMAC